MTGSSGGKEVYSTRTVASTALQENPPPVTSTPVAPPVEEADDLDIPVKTGTACKRKGCGTVFVSDEVNRKGDGPGTVCTYHPSPVRSVTLFTLNASSSVDISQYSMKEAKYKRFIFEMDI
jgi:hypothetical protein